MVGGISRVTKIGCRRSRGGSISLHIVASRVHSSMFVVNSNIVPSGDNEKCILHHLVHHTYHRNELLNMASPFLCGIISAIVSRGLSRCSCLSNGERLVHGIVLTRRRSFNGAVSTNLTLLRRCISGVSNGIFSNRSTFGLGSACNFPLSLAGSVLRRHNVAISRSGFGTLLTGRGSATHTTHGSTNTST